MSAGYLATPGREAQIRALLAWVGRLNAESTAMPWAEPPDQPDLFDRREADEFAPQVTDPLSRGVAT